MRMKSYVWLAGVVLLLLVAALALLAVSYHQVIVIDGISRAPIPRANISLELSFGYPRELGQTDLNGFMAFWNMPFPIPMRICAQVTFYANGCVNAVGLGPRFIELAVPAAAP